MTSNISEAMRGQIYHFVQRAFPKAKRQKAGIARVYVGGEKQKALERTIREKTGRVDLDGETVEEKLKTFIFTARDPQILGMLASMPRIESDTQRDPSRGAALAKQIETLLTEIGVDARFDKDGNLRNDTATSYVAALLNDPLASKLGPQERVAIFYMLEEEFPPAHYHWMEKLRRIRLTSGSEREPADILKKFIIEQSSANDLVTLLELMPQIRRRHLEDSTASQSEISKSVEQLKARIVSLLREMDIHLAFSGDQLKTAEADTSPKALADLPGRDQLRADITASLRDKQPLALVYIDLDNFKSVNDTKGHAAGDSCLEGAVKIIGAAAAFKGGTYRYGVGDELCVLLYNSSVPEAIATAERIRDGIERERLGGDDIKVTASLGVAASTDEALADADRLMNAADQALYKSKEDGKNRVSSWPIGADRVTPTKRQSVASRLLDLAISEVERNIQKTGISSLTLEDAHLKRLIAHGEQHEWDRSQSLLMGELFRLRSAGAAQKVMPSPSASQHHVNFYSILARSALDLMRQVREKL